MDIALWVIQGLLAALFLMAGGMHATQPKEKLMERLPWTEDFEPNIIKTIGVLELLGAVGIILPLLLNILPFFTPLAAIGLALTMAGAAFTHFRRNEYPAIGFNVVILLLAAFVAYGRIDLLIGG